MDKDWRNELVTKGTAYDALANLDQYAEVGECLDAIKGLPSEQPKRKPGKTLAEEVGRIKRELTDIFTEQMSTQPETHDKRTETHECDLISRQMAINALFGLYEYQRDIDPTEAADLVRQGIFLAEKKIENMPSAQPEIIRCRECKHFELDHFEKVKEIPIPVIVAHEICTKWGGGCKTSIDGWCFMAERRTDE